MGLFDCLFGKKEEFKIEEVVKEVLENFDLFEDVELVLIEVEEFFYEEVEVESFEEVLF